MASSTLRVDTITNTANTVQWATTNLGPKTAYAVLYYALNASSGTFNVGDSSSYGVQIPFNNIQASQNITAYTAGRYWTHAYTGTYIVNIMYRQNSGGDIWSVMAVTKNGNTTAVGLSARTGSGDSRMDCWSFAYTVDDTNATYQVQQWCEGTKTVTTSYSGSNPSWGNYAGLNGNTVGGGLGRAVDMHIWRVGD